MNKQTKIIIAMGIVIFLALGYIAGTLYNKKQLERNIMYFQEGQVNVVVTIFQQTNECNIMSMTILNQSRNLVDVACLSQEGGE